MTDTHEPLDLRSAIVRDVMSTAPRTLGRNDRLSLADELMRGDRIRHLPVLDEDGTLTGIVTQRDLFHSALVRALGYGTAVREKMLDSLLVKEVMTEEVVTTTPTTPLAEAAAIMAQRRIGCLPVVDGDTLAGILTEGDLVALVAASTD